MKTIPCAVCGRRKYREVSPEHRPGQYARMHLRGWCACVEDARGYTIKVGPPVEGTNLDEYRKACAGYL